VILGPAHVFFLMGDHHVMKIFAVNAIIRVINASTGFLTKIPILSVLRTRCEHRAVADTGSAGPGIAFEALRRGIGATGEEETEVLNYLTSNAIQGDDELTRTVFRHISLHGLGSGI
jgi:hypothetical protein